MTRHPFNRSKCQFDYFSRNYRRFEEDFYQFSALHIPLTFLTDDILYTMASSQQSYFKLNKENAKDKKDHYFYFKIVPSPDNAEDAFYYYIETSQELKEKVS